MAGRVPGPICSTRVGLDWIDDGTTCLNRSVAPGPLDSDPRLLLSDPSKAAFDRAHVYSLALEAARKRAMDLQIIGHDYRRGNEISLDNAAYLKQLIDMASGGQRAVQTAAKEMQFYVIEGGAEGLLQEKFRTMDANIHITHWKDTDGQLGETDLDENDVLAVFARDGTLVGAARLRRPTFVESRHGIKPRTAARVLAAWDRKTVLIYRNNRNPRWIPYLGLGVNDGFRDHGVTVDIHKEESTNGCYLIDDPSQYAPGAPDVRTFEPALIRKVIAASGLDEARITGASIQVGRMNIVSIAPY